MVSSIDIFQESYTNMALGHLRILRPVLCRLLPITTRTQLVPTSGVPSRPPVNCAVVPPNYVRHYATKKTKAKVQTAKVNINATLVEDIISLDEVKEEMAAVLATLKDEFSRNLSIRTSPGALDHITVTTKDGKFPLNQLGQIFMKSPQLLVVNVTGFPEAMAAVTRAIQESSMGLNPEVEGTIIRVPIPKVTREHRENLSKLAKQFSNKAKDSLRRVRSNAVNQLKKSKEGVSEDTIRLIEKQVQQMADSYVTDIDKQLATKTKELLG
ncbi:Ribosome-recycling factor, mitochondrial [Triplophysa tibetana]|uniref:Ribosome-recycling factor, mitochondrial n=1 Tax=Triplophysa tibetana TaxID=1572043 RepID=A0A5A9N3D1_9TELE|nr:Ribosome-recycling factor, mitochondrial [Triplophysa tibetana]